MNMNTGKKLNKDKVAEILKMFKNGYKISQIARALKITRPTIYKYVDELSTRRVVKG